MTPVPSAVSRPPPAPGLVVAAPRPRCGVASRGRAPLFAARSACGGQRAEAAFTAIVRAAVAGPRHVSVPHAFGVVAGARTLGGMPFRSPACVRRSPVAQGPPQGAPPHRGATALCRAATAASDQDSVEAASPESTHLAAMNVKSFALMEDAQVAFGRGLNVITGESGSGKSVLMDALGQLFGAAVPEECVRAPADRAVVAGIFNVVPRDFPAVEEVLDGVVKPGSLAEGGGRLEVTRQLLLNGKKESGSGARSGGVRSACTVNGRSVPVRVLRELGSVLCDFNAQHASTSLADPEEQLALLDRHAGTVGDAARFSRDHAQLERLLAQRAVMADQAARDEDAMEELVDCVVEHGVEGGEEEGLREELDAMGAVQESAEACQRVRGVLVGDGSGGVAEALSVAARDLRLLIASESAAPTDDHHDHHDHHEEEEEEEEEGEVTVLEGALEGLMEAQALLGEAGSSVEDFADGLEFDPRRADAVRARLELLRGLCRRHGVPDSAALVAEAEEAEELLGDWESFLERKEQVEGEVRELRADLALRGAELSRMRRAAAPSLCEAVRSELEAMNMGGYSLDVELTWTPRARRAGGGTSARVPSAGDFGEDPSKEYRMGPQGLDSCRFMMAPGPAEGLRPLSAIASGGESARLMLALKASALQAAGEGEGAPPISVYDEIDSGVGGRIGGKIGALLRRVCGAGHTVLCITHLPQVAAHGEHHVKVEKEAGGDGRMVTRVRVLGGREEREGELSSMLGMGRDAAGELMGLVEK